MTDSICFEDQLRVEGVNFKGFGVLPKYVMLDRDLSIEAKTIYAYFCSFAGSGNSTFPGRDKILTDLPMSKDAYYKHFKKLTDQGYIVVVQQKQAQCRFSQNIYTLVSNPKKFQEQSNVRSNNPAYSRIAFSGLKSVGYGMVPKAVMVDPRLPVKAKGIYAYFCSFTGSGDNAFPEKDRILYHLQISEPTYYKFYKLLTELNYISAVQRHVDGRLQVNDYFLNDSPDVVNASKKRVLAFSGQDLKKQDTVKTLHGGKKQDLKKQDTVKLQDLRKQDTEKQDTKLQDTEKQDTNINSLNINNLNINNSLYQKEADEHKPGFTTFAASSSRSIEGVNDREKLKKDVIKIVLSKRILPSSFSPDARKNFEAMTEAIHFMTEWDKFYPNGYMDELEQKVYNLFNIALIEMCCSSRTMNLKGSMVTHDMVIEKINELCFFHSGYVNLTEISEPAMEHYIRGSNNAEIKNPLQYMKACIWDAMQTGNIGFYEEIKRITRMGF